MKHQCVFSCIKISSYFAISKWGRDVDRDIYPQFIKFFLCLIEDHFVSLTQHAWEEKRIDAKCMQINTDGANILTASTFGDFCFAVDPWQSFKALAIS